MKKIIWKLLELIDDNHGYTTPLQKRFTIGEEVKVSHCVLPKTPLIIGETVTIIENGRHDYLVKTSRDKQYCVYQFELTRKE
jgi:hypothetical protein